MIVKIPVQFPSHVSGSFERLEVCIRQIRKLEKAIEAAPEEDKNSLRDSLSIIRAALNDLLGLFDAVESEKVASLEADLAATAGAANYFAGEKESLEKRLELKSGECSFLQTQIAANQEQIDELLRLRLRVEELEHFAASVSGLYATDRPDLVDQSLLNDAVLFKIEPPEAKK